MQITTVTTGFLVASTVPGASSRPRPGSIELVRFEGGLGFRVFWV